ncbi:MAG TPA: protein kinase [Kofleriaceae bacterium]|nr:protein kinase [Kofleriaceae bacterium]
MEGLNEDLSGRLLGEYTLLEKIGEGGNGDVYRAEHRILRTPACVKVMNRKRRLLSEGEQRFLREAQLASKIQHDNVAHIYHFGVEREDGLMWIAMQLVEGLSLSTYIETHGPMPMEDAAPLLADIYEGVAAVHAQGIVHRDLKPSNVMLVLNTNPKLPGRFRAKLIDFGLAKGEPGSLVEEYVPEPFADNPDDRVATVRLGEPRRGQSPPTPTVSELQPKHVKPHERQLTPTGARFGTPSYMSPEQSCNAKKVDARADIYSLGIMTFETLAGYRPSPEEITSGNMSRRRHRHSNQVLSAPGVSEEIARVLKRALATRPGDRQATVRELAADVQRALQADPGEQLRSRSRQWEANGRSPDYLARGPMLVELRRIAQSPAVARNLGEPEESFISTSLRRARRRLGVFCAVGALVVMSIFLVHAETRSRDAEKFATESEVERGQQALLDGKSDEAVHHLGQAYQRGDHSPGVAFMLARALQPRTSELAHFASGAGRMWSAMFAPDGKRVLTTDDKRAQMWDAASGQLLFTMSHGDTVYAAVFSPDGSKVITAGGDGTVRIWSATNGVALHVLKHDGGSAQPWRYAAVAMSSSFVAAIDIMGKVVHVWHADTEQEINNLATDGQGLPLVAFSNDGRWLAASGHNEVRVFDTTSWQQAAAIPAPRVRSLRFAPDDSRLALGTYDGAASIWEVPNGTRIHVLREAGASIDAIAFSRDGAMLAIASRDGLEQVWNASSGGLKAEFHTHRDKIYTVEFSRSGDVLLSAGADGAAVVSNVATGMPVTRLEGPKGLIITAHFDSESRRVVGASWDGTARVWSSASPYLRWASPQIAAECLEESLVPDRRFIAFGCQDNSTQVWDTEQGESLAQLPGVTALDDGVVALPAVTAKGDRAAIARGRTVEIYALPSGQLLRAIAHPAAVSAVAFVPEGHDTISGAIDGSLLLTQDGREPIALPASPAAIDAVAVLSDGRVVVTDASTRVRVIDHDRKTLMMDLTAASRTRLLRPSPDGFRMVTISTTSTQSPPLLWDLQRYRLVGQLDGHVGRVFTARFVRIGKRQEILTAGADGTARLWEAATGARRQTFHGDSHFLADAVLSPDGEMVVAGGSDGFLRFWDTSNERLLWMMQAHRSYVTGVHYEGVDLVTRSFAGDVARWSLPVPSVVVDGGHADLGQEGK